MQMVASAPASPTQSQDEEAYSVRQVAALFDVSERKLRYWSQTGFIRPSIREGSRVFYSFRDLIAVKVAKALLEGGTPLRRVRRSLAALSQTLPEVNASLASLRVRCEGDALVIDHHDRTYDANTGQLVLDFEVSELKTEVAQVLSLPWVGAEDIEPTTAYDWFHRGCELEAQWSGSPVDVSGFEAARHAYEQALELDPEFGAAWTNLGSMMAEVGENDEARSFFQRALGCDPDQPEAHCNLAELSLREGDADAAIAGYRQVLRLDPDWSEAHYGLARALLEVGGKAQALAHLERFCAALRGQPELEEDPELQARHACAVEAIESLRGDIDPG